MDGNDAQHPEEPSSNWQFKPGDVVGGNTAQSVPQPKAQPAPTQVSDVPAPAVQPRVVQAPSPRQAAPASLVDDVPEPMYQSADQGMPGITWTASEYIAHSKGAEWYGLLGASAFALAAIIWLITKDKVSTAGVVVVAILFGVVAARKPRVLTYQLMSQGITIGARFYPFADFKSFSLIKEGSINNITFMPMRRFMPPLSVYFAPDDERRIIEVISQQLPFLQDEGDPLDRFLRRIRF